MEQCLRDWIDDFLHSLSRFPDPFDEQILPDVLKLFEQCISRGLAKKTKDLISSIPQLEAEIETLSDEQKSLKWEHAKRLNRTILRNHEIRRQIAQRREQQREIELTLEETRRTFQPIVAAHASLRSQAHFVHRLSRDLRDALSQLRADLSSFSSADLVWVRQTRVALLNWAAVHRRRRPPAPFSDLHQEIRSLQVQNAGLRKRVTALERSDWMTKAARRKKAVIAHQIGTGLADTAGCSFAGIADRLAHSAYTEIQEKDEEVRAKLQAMASRHAALAARIKEALSSATRRIDVSFEFREPAAVKQNPIAVLSRTMDEISQLRRSRIVTARARKPRVDSSLTIEA